MPAGRRSRATFPRPVRPTNITGGVVEGDGTELDGSSTNRPGPDSECRGQLAPTTDAAALSHRTRFAYRHIHAILAERITEAVPATTRHAGCVACSTAHAHPEPVPDRKTGWARSIAARSRPSPGGRTNSTPCHAQTRSSGTRSAIGPTMRAGHWPRCVPPALHPEGTRRSPGRLAPPTNRSIPDRHSGRPAIRWETRRECFEGLQSPSVSHPAWEHPGRARLRLRSVPPECAGHPATRPHPASADPAVRP